MKQPLYLSVVVVSWNTRDLLRDCLQSALASLGTLSAEIIVVDNASADDSAGMVRRVFGDDPRVRLVANSRNEGFARGNNQACAVARGEFLAIDTALARLQPGDLCLILVDQVQEALAHLAERVKETRDVNQPVVA